MLNTIYYESTDLMVVPDILPSTVHFPRFTKAVSNIIYFTPYIKGVIVGLILSDGWLTIASKSTKNARLGFKQSLGHFEYLWSVFTLLSHYCSSLPHLTTGVRANARFFGLGFFTRCLPCFTDLHSLFYVNGVKIIPENIYDLLTPIALAHWICGDGSVSRHGLVLCTDSYSLSDNVKLMNVLMVKFQLDCTLRYSTSNRPRIYIRERSMETLRTIVLPYMDSSMLYKIKL